MFAGWTLSGLSCDTALDDLRPGRRAHRRRRGGGGVRGRRLRAASHRRPQRLGGGVRRRQVPGDGLPPAPPRTSNSPYEDTLTLTAQPEAGYMFAGWTLSGLGCVDSQAACAQAGRAHRRRLRRGRVQGRRVHSLAGGPPVPTARCPCQVGGVDARQTVARRRQPRASPSPSSTRWRSTAARPRPATRSPAGRRSPASSCAAWRTKPSARPPGSSPTPRRRRRSWPPWTRPCPPPPPGPTARWRWRSAASPRRRGRRRRREPGLPLHRR